jgi:ribosome-binding factor A
MPGRKIEHLNERIRQKLGMLLQREVSDPRLARVTIVGVNVSRDLAHAGVRFSCYDPAVKGEELTEALNKAAGFLSRALARTLETRKSPQLHFVYDPGFDYALEMELALKRVRPLEGDLSDTEEGTP